MARNARKNRSDCAFNIPHEITGMGEMCGLLGTTCNGYGKKCPAYRKETKEEREYIERKIAEAKARKKG